MIFFFRTKQVGLSLFQFKLFTEINKNKPIQPNLILIIPKRFMEKQPLNLKANYNPPRNWDFK